MKRIVVGITGASGAVLGVRLLRMLTNRAEVYLIITKEGWHVIKTETSCTTEEIKKLAVRYFENDDFSAPIASGSYPTNGMIVVPCSIRCLSAVAHSYSDTLLVRSADVTLKQRRPLILGVRETPLHGGHINLMAQAHAIGAIIAPPVPAFYHQPQSIEEVVDHYLFSILDLLGIEVSGFKRWGSPEPIDIVQ